MNKLSENKSENKLNKKSQIKKDFKEQMSKKVKEENPARTKILKDRVLSGVVDRAVDKAKWAVPGAVVGAGVGAAKAEIGSQVGGKAVKHIVNPAIDKALKNPNIAKSKYGTGLKVARGVGKFVADGVQKPGARKARLALGAAAGGAVGGKKMGEVGGAIGQINRLDKEYKAKLGRLPSEDEYAKTLGLDSQGGNLSKAKAYRDLIYTPKSMVKSEIRQQYRDKKALDEIECAIEKNANAMLYNLKRRGVNKLKGLTKNIKSDKVKDIVNNAINKGDTVGDFVIGGKERVVKRTGNKIIAGAVEGVSNQGKQYKERLGKGVLYDKNTKNLIKSTKDKAERKAIKGDVGKNRRDLAITGASIAIPSAGVHYYKKDDYPYKMLMNKSSNSVDELLDKLACEIISY